MKKKVFNNLLLFSLFGIALGFFGMLYEGVVTIPKMLDSSMARMLFWEDYYRILSPTVYYIPMIPLATILLVILYFVTAKEKAILKQQLGLAAILQITALAITFYIVKQINLQTYFDNIPHYADIIPVKTMLVNILSMIRLVFAFAALALTLRGYIQTQRAQN